MRRSVVPTPERFTRFLPVIVTVLWGMFVFASIYMLNRYESTPGDPGTPVNEWPQKLPIVRQAGKMTLITVVHPRCTCSKASFTELTRAIVAAPRSADIHIVFYYPPHMLPESGDAELVAMAKATPGIKVWFDHDGSMVNSLGVRTSFDVFLFDVTGKILFRGGVTSGRGVYGENPSSAALVAYLRGETAKPNHPVFGCPLRENTKNLKPGV